MRRDVRSYLWDIVQAADAISLFIAGIEQDDFSNRALVHSAVERKFEIIGEALNQLDKAAPEVAARIPEYRRIIAFRNLLIHGYAAIDLARVWQIAIIDLPRLAVVAGELLRELDAPPS